jgi:hypothetical protein
MEKSGPRQFNKSIRITPNPNANLSVGIVAPTGLTQTYDIIPFLSLPTSLSTVFIDQTGQLSTGAGTIPTSSLFSLDFGDVNQSLIKTVSGLITKVKVAVTQSFNGIGASITIGSLANPTLLFQSNQIDMSQATEFENPQSVFISTATDIYVFYTTGTGASQGKLYILLETN